MASMINQGQLNNGGGLWSALCMNKQVVLSSTDDSTSYDSSGYSSDELNTVYHPATSQYHSSDNYGVFFAGDSETSSSEDDKSSSQEDMPQYIFERFVKVLFDASKPILKDEGIELSKKAPLEEIYNLFMTQRYHEIVSSVKLDNENERKLISIIREYGQLKEKISRPLICVIKIQHISIGDNTGGCHFCPKDNNVLFKSLRQVIFGTNGVFQAEVPLAHGTKKSTFFPRDKISTIDQLISTIIGAIPMAKAENRVLCKVPGQAFKIEAYMSAFYVTTAFPLIYYGKYNGMNHHKITVGCKSYTDAELLNILKVNKNLPKFPIMFERTKNDRDYIVIDISKMLPELNISNGIYYQIERNAF